MKPKLITKSQEITKLNGDTYEIRFVVTIEASSIGYSAKTSDERDSGITERIKAIVPGAYSMNELRKILGSNSNLYAARKVERAVALGLLEKTNNPKTFIKP